MRPPLDVINKGECWEEAALKSANPCSFGEGLPAMLMKCFEAALLTSSFRFQPSSVGTSFLSTSSSSVDQSILHHPLPLRTCHAQTTPSSTLPKIPAPKIPALSLTVTAPRLNSLSFSSTSSLTAANVLTYTNPPKSPSQKMMAKTM